MTEYIMLGAVSIVALILLILRTNTGVVFLTLCSGTILLEVTGSDVGLFASSVGKDSELAASLLKIAVLVLPALITALLLKKQVTSTKFFLTFIPAVCTGLLGILLVVPLLSLSLQTSVETTQFWDLLVQNKSTIVTVGIVASVVCVVMTVRRAHHSGEKSKKHKH